MALPGDTLSSSPVVAAYRNPGELEDSYRSVDYEDGGEFLGDPTQGLLFQTWRLRAINNEIWLDAPNTPAYVVYSGTAVTDVALAFDQNMNLVYAYRDLGRVYLSWFDTVTGQRDVIDFGPDLLTPKLTLDDKRPEQSGRSDVILAYIRNGGLYYRQQRDRFTVEYLLDAGPFLSLERIGMNDNFRLQFTLTRDV